MTYVGKRLHGRATPAASSSVFLGTGGGMSSHHELDRDYRTARPRPALLGLRLPPAPWADGLGKRRSVARCGREAIGLAAAFSPGETSTAVPGLGDLAGYLRLSS